MNLRQDAFQAIQTRQELNHSANLPALPQINKICKKQSLGVAKRLQEKLFENEKINILE